MTRRAVRAALLAAILGPAAAGCATYERGSFSALSSEALSLDLAVVDRDAEGRACGPWVEPRYRLALEDALHRSGGDALVDARYTWERLCIVVRGTAVRLR